MKKQLIIIAVAAFGFFTNVHAFAPKKKTSSLTSPKIEKAFLEQFGELPDVEWSRQGNDMLHASFTVDNTASDAYFDNDGNFVCVNTPVQKENLPLKLRMAMNTKLEGCTIGAILQTNTSEETAYYIHATSDKGVKVWKGYANGSIELFKKIK